MPTNRFQFLALPISIGLIGLAACGGGDPSKGPGNGRVDGREAALNFARCMREHGIDMPDPTFGRKAQPAVSLPAGGKLASNRAEAACRRYLEAARGPEPSADEQRQFREGALRQARCMRENGIDMPDPTFSARGALVALPKGVGPENPRFQEAQSKCAKYDPKGAMRR